MSSSNLRLHIDAVIPVGNAVVETTDGAVTVAVPTGASGIIVQRQGTENSFWSFQSMSAADQGFKFENRRELIWFSSAVTNFYLFLNASDIVVYQFVAPV